MVRFVQMKDEFDPATQCGLCEGPIDENGNASARLTVPIVLQLIHAFREWTAAWDNYHHDNSRPMPLHLDKFAEELVSKYKDSEVRPDGREAQQGD